MLPEITKLRGQRRRPLLLWARRAAGALPLHWFSLSSMAQGGVKGGCCTLHGFAPQLMDPELRKPQSSIKSQRANLFNLSPGGTHYPYLPGQKTNLFSLRGRFYLCVPRLFAVQTSLKKMAQSKSCQCLSSENGHKRTMENAFSTFLNWFLKVRCDLVK